MGSLIRIIFIIIAVAFFTLIERKVLGYIHIRKGPNKPRVRGILVPFADAVKLFLKEVAFPQLGNKFLFYGICVLVLGVPIILWIIYPLFSMPTAIKYRVVYILAWARVAVYGTLGVGWASNSKYSFLGAIRAVAQTISYEVRITIIVLGSVFFIFYDCSLDKQIPIIRFILGIFLLFLVSILAEANRSPFDFAEGERELVRGFNTEFSSIHFVIVFLAEYISIIFISFLAAILFIRISFTTLIIFGLINGFFYIWSRGTLPRFRYDQLMYLAWKVFLPISLLFLFLVTLLFSFFWILKILSFC